MHSFQKSSAAVPALELSSHRDVRKCADICRVPATSLHWFCRSVMWDPGQSSKAGQGSLGRGLPPPSLSSPSPAKDCGQWWFPVAPGFIEVTAQTVNISSHPLAAFFYCFLDSFLIILSYLLSGCDLKINACKNITFISFIYVFIEV